MAKNLNRMFEIMNECERLDIRRITEWLKGLDCKYIIVKHDMDAPRLPHFHVFVKLVNARSFKDIATQLQIEPQYIQKIKNWKNALAYAFHLTDNAKDDGKYQYTKDAVISSCGVDIDGIFKLSQEYQNEKMRENELLQLLYKYGNCEITKAELMKNFTPKDYDKFALKVKRMQEYRIMKVGDRNMNVLYITGDSGAGKTTLAKYMARVMNYDYFVSGSGKDVLDGYDKEECIILDDLRADVFTKAELFKLTDNNTNSSVKSRFKNKDISYCKLMIITSIKWPTELYNWNTDNFDDKDETFKQFARRIGNKFLYVKSSGVIFECQYGIDDYTNTKKIMCPFTMSQVFQVLGIEPKLGKSLMDEIFAKIKQDVDKEIQEADDLPF